MEVEIKFQPPLRRGVLVSHRQGQVDVKLEYGGVATVSCSNVFLQNYFQPGRAAALSYHPENTLAIDNEKIPTENLSTTTTNKVHAALPRKNQPYIVEMVQMDNVWVGLNPALSRSLTALAVKYTMIPELISFTKIRQEFPNNSNKWIDFLLEGSAGPGCLDVESVSLLHGDIAYFPDVVSDRAIKRLEGLMEALKQGYRAVILFLIARKNGKDFRPADHTTPAYGQLLRQAASAGVEILCYRASVSPSRIAWGPSVPKDLSPQTALTK